MGAMKRELERLAEVVIYGDPQTIKREFDKVAGLADGGAVEVMAYAVEMAREIAPLCECGADYHESLKERFAEFSDVITNQQPNKEATQ
jgi:hypothetical protein